MRIPLLVPCDRLALASALASGADALIFDLGEPGPAADRAAARRAARDGLRAAGAARASLLRVVALDLVPADDDLDAVMPARPDAVLLRGAVGARDIQHLAAKLAVREAEHGLPQGRTGILAAPADAPDGVLALPGLAGASPRLRGLVWDAGRLAAALGVADAAAGPCRDARSLVVLAAAAAGVPALDGSPGAAEACADAARDGFSGVVAREAGEVPVIARWFPS